MTENGPLVDDKGNLLIEFKRVRPRGGTLLLAANLFIKEDVDKEVVREAEKLRQQLTDQKEAAC